MSNPQARDPFEELLLRDLVAIRINKLKYCPVCKKRLKINQLYRIESRATFAHSCRYHLSPRAGTILEKSKTPIGRWLLVIIWLVEEPKISNLEILRRLSGTTYKTVWRMRHQINTLAPDDELIKLAIKRMRLGAKT